jgi:hypothetical protein
MLGFRAEFENADWCLLVHGETPGKAKSRFLRIDPCDGWDGGYTDIRLTRIPGLDNRPITFENAHTAGFHYAYEEEGEPDFDYEKAFSNECDCPICRAKGD